MKLPLVICVTVVIYVIAQSVQRWATGWTIGVLGFDSRRELGIFLFTIASRMDLEPIEPPIQWVPGALSLGVNRPGREADHSPPSSAEVKECVELYLHSPNMPSWRGAQFKKKSQWQLYLYQCEDVQTLSHANRKSVTGPQYSSHPEKLFP
jgi:hypothetical protein